MGKLLIGLLLVLVFVIIIAVQVDGAVNCAHQGGEYVRNWVNWPVCVGGSK